MSDNSEKMNVLIEAETNFGLSLLRQQDLNSSIVLSPVSIALALSLVHLASNGETKNQIKNAIANGSSDDELIEHYSNLSSALLSAEKGTEVNVANHIFSRDGFSIKQEYLDSAKKYYEAGASSLDFSDQSAAADAINNFVSESTRNHIKEIIKADGISDDLVALLVNALYFKAKWNVQFKAQKTTNLDFYSSENEKREIPFLREIGHRQFAENEDWRVLKLDYKDQSYSFFVFLPTQRFGLQDSIQKLDSKTIQHLLTNTTNTRLDIQIPKISIESSLGLKESLEKLGITDAFSQSSADLSNLATNVFVSSVAHKAKIDVDEEGTTASAATTISITLKSMPIALEDPIPFHADHPFLFILVKDTHPLFIGVHN